MNTRSRYWVIAVSKEKHKGLVLTDLIFYLGEKATISVGNIFMKKNETNKGYRVVGI